MTTHDELRKLLATLKDLREWEWEEAMDKIAAALPGLLDEVEKAEELPCPLALLDTIEALQRGIEHNVVLAQDECEKVAALEEQRGNDLKLCDELTAEVETYRAQREHFVDESDKAKAEVERLRGLLNNQLKHHCFPDVHDGGPCNICEDSRAALTGENDE